jgi:histone H3/H4
VVDPQHHDRGLTERRTPKEGRHERLDKPPVRRRARQIGVVDRLLTRTITGFHRAILRRTGGRVMNKMGGIPGTDPDHHRDMQRTTDRDIPVVRLSPIWSRP